MIHSFRRVDPTALSGGCLACILFEDHLPDLLATIDHAEQGRLQAWINSHAISTKLAQCTPLLTLNSLPNQRLVIVGAGKRDDFTEAGLAKAMKAVMQYTKDSQLTQISIALNDWALPQRPLTWVAQMLAQWAQQYLYSYDTTTTKKHTLCLEQIEWLSDDPAVEAAVQQGSKIAQGINVARQLGNLPGNLCTPTYLADQAADLAARYERISVEVIDESTLEAMGAGAFVSVSKGSTQPGKLILIHYRNADAAQQPYVLVGKGITFDTGGICIKPGAAMDEMKFDMCGSAAVLGTLSAVAALQMPLNVIGVIAAAENMPAGNASKPGDVVTSLSGKTIEIINTDAEGRLVLCDALTYVERYQPRSVIDIATLTGAVVVGLGHHPTAIYANDEALQQALLAAGQHSWDRGWAMPLWPEYKEELESPYADFKHVGNGRAGGSITAASFLSVFTQAYPWAHLDIAGTAWSSAKEGATGRPVGLLVRYLLNQLDQ